MTTLPAGVEANIIGFLNLIADGEFDILAAITHNVRMTAGDMRAAVAASGRTIVRGPDLVIPPGVEVVHRGTAPRREVLVSVPLYTADGACDVRFELLNIEIASGELWRKELLSIGVR